MKALLQECVWAALGCKGVEALVKAWLFLHVDITIIKILLDINFDGLSLKKYYLKNIFVVILEFLAYSN